MIREPYDKHMVEHLHRPILIHCCKDKTLSYRRRNQRVFNGVALPVFSVDNEADAEALFLLVGRKQMHEHPDMPGRPWYKMTLDGDLDFKRHLELTDLLAVTEKLSLRYAQLLSIVA